MQILKKQISQSKQQQKQAINQSHTYTHTFTQVQRIHMNHFRAFPRENKKRFYIALFLLSPGLYELDLRIL